jgi:hypothetical protein
MDEVDVERFEGAIAGFRHRRLSRAEFVREVLAAVGDYDPLTRSLMLQEAECRVAETFADFWRGGR